MPLAETAVTVGPEPASRIRIEIHKPRDERNVEEAIKVRPFFKPGECDVFLIAGEERTELRGVTSLEVEWHAPNGGALVSIESFDGPLKFFNPELVIIEKPINSP